MAQDNKRGARRAGGATHPMMIGVFMGVLLGAIVPTAVLARRRIQLSFLTY